jgi:hypothetical protein
VETSTLVRKGYDRNCLHHVLEVLNNPVPPPSTPSLEYEVLHLTYLCGVLPAPHVFRAAWQAVLNNMHAQSAAAGVMWPLPEVR